MSHGARQRTGAGSGLGDPGPDGSKGSRGCRSASNASACYPQLLPQDIRPREGGGKREAPACQNTGAGAWSPDIISKCRPPKRPHEPSSSTVPRNRTAAFACANAGARHCRHCLPCLLTSAVNLAILAPTEGNTT